MIAPLDPYRVKRYAATAVVRRGPDGAGKALRVQVDGVEGYRRTVSRRVVRTVHGDRAASAGGYVHPVGRRGPPGTRER